LQEYWRMCLCLCIKIGRLKVKKLLIVMVRRQTEVQGV